MIQKLPKAKAEFSILCYFILRYQAAYRVFNYKITKELN